MKKSSLLSVIALVAIAGFLFTACPQEGEEAKTFTVTFNAGQDGTVNPATITVEEGKTIATLPTPTKASNTFGGWFTNLEDPATQFTTATRVTGNITVYAKWTPTDEQPANRVTVTFDAQGGTPTPTAIQVDAGGTITLPTAPTKDKYDFGGWYTQANGGGTQFTSSTPVTGNITVYAHWTVKAGQAKYTVTFNGNGGTPTSPSLEVVANGTITTLPTANRDDYEFKGWFTTETGATQFTTSTTVSANITVYAQWTEEEEETEEFTVSFEAKSGDTGVTGLPAAQTVASGGKATKPETDPTRTGGYVFDDWYNGTAKWDFNTLVTQDITLTAGWVQTFTVSFGAKSGDTGITGLPAAQTVASGGKATKPTTDPTRTGGYVFDDWYNGDTKWNFETGTVTANITLTAGWLQDVASAYSLSTVEGVNPTSPDNNNRLRIAEAKKNTITGVTTIKVAGSVTGGIPQQIQNDIWSEGGNGKPTTGNWSWAVIKGILPAGIQAGSNIVIKQTNPSFVYYTGMGSPHESGTTEVTGPVTITGELQLPALYIPTDERLPYKWVQYGTGKSPVDDTDNGFGVLFWSGANPKQSTIEITPAEEDADPYTVIVDWSGVTINQ